MTSETQDPRTCPDPAPHGPTEPTEWPRIGVFGAGAVGCYYGARLALAGAPVTLVGCGPHVHAIRAQGLVLHAGRQRRGPPVRVHTAPAGLAHAPGVPVFGDCS